MATHLVTAPPPPRSHSAASTLGLAVLVLSALFGGNALGMREALLGSETPEALPTAVGRTADGPAGAAGVPTTSPGSGAAGPVAPPEPERTVLRSWPWWQSVGTVKGTGTMTAAPVQIDSVALQARVTWTCETGTLVVRVPGRARPIIDGSCPGSGVGYTIEKGSVAMQVTASGRWELAVDQQLDLPLVEPPLPAMTAPGASLVLTGPLYRMDQVGTGTLNVYRLADGSYAMRLDKFFVTANLDLELRLSPLEAPRTTEQFLSAPSVLVAPLDITTGSLNFKVPPEVDPTKYRSVVIWCPLINSAYAAVTLRPA